MSNRGGLGGTGTPWGASLHSPPGTWPGLTPRQLGDRDTGCLSTYLPTAISRGPAVPAAAACTPLSGFQKEGQGSKNEVPG